MGPTVARVSAAMTTPPAKQHPTMVVHGTADPVLPIEHGKALALGIDGAVDIEVEQLGHEAPAAFLEELTPSLLHHLAHARQG